MYVLSVVIVAVTRAQWEEKPSVPVFVKSSNMCPDKRDNVPLYTVKPEPVYVFKLGKPAKIVCEATGTPKPYVYWIKGKKDMTGKEKRLRVTGVGEAILFFDSLTEDDVDVYTCVVEDCCRSEMKIAETEIKVDVRHTCQVRDKPPREHYQIVWDFKTWREARAYCEERGMTLAVPQTEEENKAIHDAIVEQRGTDPNGKKFAHHNMIWLGIADGIDEGTFSDIYTKKAISYKNFLPKQPDNWVKHDVLGQDAVAIDRITGSWDDSYGFWKRPFACFCPERSSRKY